MPEFQKMANARLRDARAAFPIAGRPLQGLVVRIVTELFRIVGGGLWVGGTITLHRDRLEFTPNDINKRMHDHVGTVSIPTADVRSVETRFGFVTGIIEVRSQSAFLEFRCYDAKGTAQRLRDVVEQARRAA